MYAPVKSTTYNMYYTHLQSCFNHLICPCHEELAVIVVFYFHVKVGCQSTLTLKQNYAAYDIPSLTSHFYAGVAVFIIYKKCILK